MPFWTEESKKLRVHALRLYTIMRNSLQAYGVLAYETATSIVSPQRLPPT